MTNAERLTILIAVLIIVLFPPTVLATIFLIDIVDQLMRTVAEWIIQLMI